MNKSLFALVLILSALIAASILTGCAKPGASPGNKPEEKPGQWNIQTDYWSATVESLDLSTRTATLRDQTGKRHTFTVPDEVQNLDKVRVGDVVDAEVVEAYAIFVRKSSEAPHAQEAVDTQYGLVAGLPARTVAASVEVTALVTEVDYGKRTLTLRNPGEEVVSVKVPEEVKNFGSIKVGDEVVTRYTRNTLYSVRKP